MEVILIVDLDEFQVCLVFFDDIKIVIGCDFDFYGNFIFSVCCFDEVVVIVIVKVFEKVLFIVIKVEFKLYICCFYVFFCIMILQQEVGCKFGFIFQCIMLVV